MKKVCVLVLALVVTLVTPSLAVPAHAEVPAVPDDVAEWFAHSAPSVVASLSSPSADVAPNPDGLTPFPYGTTVGEPVPVMIWGDAFLKAARPTAEMLESPGEWIAPILSEGQPIGVIYAGYSGDGTLGWGVEPDSDKGAALLQVRPGGIVVSDGLNGLFVIEDGAARQFGLAHLGTEPVPGSLKQLQGAITAQRAEIAAIIEEAGEIVAGGAPIAFDQYILDHPDTAAPWRELTLAVTLALLAGLGTWMYWRTRRHGEGASAAGAV